MTPAQNCLLVLLGRALFGVPDALPPDTDWQALFREAESHAVHLLAYDCLTEPERQALPPETADSWRQAALASAWYNEALLEEQRAVLKALADVPLVILKGSSSALCYPQPELRCAGDIDLLVSPGDMARAEATLAARGYCPSEDEHPYHRSMRREQFAVELHFEPPGIPPGDAGVPLRAYFQGSAGEAVERAGLPVLPPERQAVLLLLHKLEHVISSGLGLRQLCDWAVFVHREMGPALWATLEPELARFGLLRFARVVTRVCVEALSLPEADAPWCMAADGWLCRELLEDILRTGNFGRKENRYGQRLFTDGQPGGRLASLARTGLVVCCTHWPPCRRHPILLPAAPFVLVLRYRRQRREGKCPPLRPLVVYRGAGERQKLYQALLPFQPEEPGSP